MSELVRKKQMNKQTSIKEDKDLLIEFQRSTLLKELSFVSKDNLNSNGITQSLNNSLLFLRKEWSLILQEPFLGLNLVAGLTVAAVALPLNLALAIAAGLPPTNGLIAGAIGGAFAAIFGGSRFQATGPAAALNSFVFLLVQKFGPTGAMAAALIVGIIQVILSMFSAGNLIKYVPEAILLGFTTGVGVKLLDAQLPRLFGIDWTLYEMLSDFTNPIWLHEVSWPAVVCGLFVIFFILACKTLPRFPAALIGIAITTQLAVFLDWTIHRVGMIPPLMLNLSIPDFSMSGWLELIQIAIPLGLLAATESVLSAQVLDRMSGEKHHSNLEILGQGIGNLASGLAGGMPVSGVIVRSSVNVQSGAKNRLASLFHAMILLGSALFLSGIISKIPIASLAGLLCIIGFRLIEVAELFHFFKQNKALAIGFLAATIGTVSDHIVIGLALGLTISWLGTREKNKLFQSEQPRRVSNTHQTKTVDNSKLSQADESVTPAGVKELQSKDERKQYTNKSNIVYSVLDRGERWLQHLKERANVPSTAFVHHNASVIGRVVMGKNVHIAAEASVRADEGTPFYIGDDSNVQDGVVIHALKQKWIEVHQQKWAVYIGSNVSLAHQALVHGPCYIGNNTFVGFKAVVHDSIIGKGCYIGIGALVVGVELSEDRYVPHGAIIDTNEKAKALTKVSSQHQHFNEDVVEVNKGLAQAYRELSYNPST